MEPADGHPTIQHCIRSFEPYLAANRRTEKPVIHISLNPHPDDVLTDEQLTAIGQEYMEKMGYGNQPYIIYRHEDIGRPHRSAGVHRKTGKNRRGDDAEWI